MNLVTWQIYKVFNTRKKYLLLMHICKIGPKPLRASICRIYCFIKKLNLINEIR
jgi:hypothetical protein